MPWFHAMSPEWWERRAAIHGWIDEGGRLDNLIKIQGERVPDFQMDRYAPHLWSIGCPVCEWTVWMYLKRGERQLREATWHSLSQLTERHSILLDMHHGRELAFGAAVNAGRRARVGRPVRSWGPLVDGRPPHSTKNPVRSFRPVAAPAARVPQGTRGRLKCHPSRSTR